MGVETKKYPDVNVGYRVEQLMNRKGITKSELAKKIGCNRKTLNEYCSGDCAMNIVILTRLCKTFNVSADYILFGKEG